MNMVPLALQGAWKVLAAGLVLGAGLPILYAFGVRGLAMAKGSIVGQATAKPIGKLIWWAVLLVILLAVSYGISFIVATGLGKQVTFEYILPWFVDKKK